jgi:hypothetical protein
MVDNNIIGNSLSFLYSTIGRNIKAKEWCDLRNQFLREQGIGGVIKGTKKSKSIPSWWPEGTEFWFAEPELEILFILKWSSKTAQ